MGDVVGMRRRDGLSVMHERIARGEYSSASFSKLAEDMHEAYGVSDHPKRGLLFVIAAYHGGNGGPSAILKWYDELVHLLY